MFYNIVLLCCFKFGCCHLLLLSEAAGMEQQGVQKSMEYSRLTTRHYITLH